ncbi:SDR family NAD(P)-dependent oxidoreductase [Novosphingobium sp. B 225]|uniref:SDR family NAD(P)-dependent oxidoreductase n=1 Tax=Novosphingobium sp. B 225 TaxID=1961849 RepID=UPI0020CF92A8|nr:SDR family NAD(P)-dependent oxidoreductase [Novosphingobium sp. B 225]
MMDRAQRLLDGKAAIITGASRGIGAAIARRFAAEGARVALVARTLDPGDQLPGSLREVAETIRAAGGECLPVQGDLSRDEDLERIVAESTAAFGAPTVLVNNAAWSRFPPIWDAPLRHLQLAMQMNVYAPQRLSQLVYPGMKAAGQGWIVNISSATADLPAPAPWDRSSRSFEFQHNGHAALYGTSKAALDRLTAGWAVELAGSGTAANSLAPVGAVASEGAVKVGGWDERDHIEPVEAMAEAALQLSWRPAEDLSGRVVRSLPLLQELGVAVRGLDGLRMAEHV